MMHVWMLFMAVFGSVSSLMPVGNSYSENPIRLYVMF
jgi:hypothetical protein